MVDLYTSLFQSTLPRGSDRSSSSLPPTNAIFQSTLPRGSDTFAESWSWQAINFNPRSLAGATSCFRYFWRFAIFQSTLPRGSDAVPLSPYGGQKYFNPRSLAGATDIEAQYALSGTFQSTLPRGSDGHSLKVDAGGKISIHAPSRERLLMPPSFVATASNFNPRSLAGATLLLVACRYLSTNFNPRSLAGATNNVLKEMLL